MPSEKLSISLSNHLVQFIEQYKTNHQCKSRSVVAAALELLRNREFEEAYRQASQEVDSAWDAVVGDGLADETW